MVEYLKKAAEVLKQRIRINLDQIHHNEEQIKEILKEPVSSDRSERLNRRFKINKKMIDENNLALKLHKDIVHYLESFQETIISPQQFINSMEESKDYSHKENYTIKLKKDDYFDLTINKEIEFDARHPYYDDPEFLNSLLDYYISVEDYEMCATLKQNMQS